MLNKINLKYYNYKTLNVCSVWILAKLFLKDMAESNVHAQVHQRYYYYNKGPDIRKENQSDLKDHSRAPML